MTTRLKQALHPLRPVLVPIWRPVRRATRWLLGTPRTRALRRARASAVAVDAARALTRTTAPIRPLRLHELADLAATVAWYRPRETYMVAACEIAGELIRRKRLRTALELGPHLQSLIVGGDIMALSENPALEATGRRIIHDATSVPWPVADKEYGLFMALQVFEHLGSSQPQVFLEVRRVARNAIISLPIDWEMEDPTNCHHQLSHERALSWFAPVVPTRVVVGNAGHRKRLIYVFEDLPAPSVR
jgi:hypothetical protein